MVKFIFLLMPTLEAQSFKKVLSNLNQDLRFFKYSCGLDLPEPNDLRWSSARILSFEFSDIVPEEVLKASAFGAYNFHPGSPAYPGWSPALFAAQEGAPVFGATLHEMTAKVDAGPIVGTELFQTASPLDQHQLEKQAYQASLNLLKRFAPDLALAPTIPVATWQSWQGQRRTRRQAALLQARLAAQQMTLV